MLQFLSFQVIDGIIDIINNLLYDNNREGWRILQTVSRSLPKFK